MRKIQVITPTQPADVQSGPTVATEGIISMGESRGEKKRRLEGNNIRREGMTGEELEEISPTGSESSAFASGKSFWMSFLRESPSIGSTETGQTHTPLGREIQNMWSSGSPLSECSAFAEGSNDPSPESLAKEYDRLTDYSILKLENRQANFLEQPSRNDENSGHRRASQGSRPSPLLAARRSIPTPESGKVTPRYFGDVTNRIDQWTPSPGTSNGDTKPRTKVAELAGAFETEANNGKPVMRSPSDSSQDDEHGEVKERKRINVTEPSPQSSVNSRVTELAEFLEKRQIAISSSFTHTHTSKEGGDRQTMKLKPSTTPIPNCSNDTLYKSPVPDPIISMGGPLSTPVSQQTTDSQSSETSTGLSKRNIAVQPAGQKKIDDMRNFVHPIQSPTGQSSTTSSVQQRISLFSSSNPSSTVQNPGAFMRKSRKALVVSSPMPQNNDAQSNILTSRTATGTADTVATHVSAALIQQSERQQTSSLAIDIATPPQPETRFFTLNSPKGITFDQNSKQWPPPVRTLSPFESTSPRKTGFEAAVNYQAQLVTNTEDAQGLNNSGIKKLSKQWPPPLRTSDSSDFLVESRRTPETTMRQVIQHISTSVGSRSASLQNPSPEITGDCSPQLNVQSNPSKITKSSGFKKIYQQWPPPSRTSSPFTSPFEKKGQSENGVEVVEHIHTSMDTKSNKILSESANAESVSKHRSGFKKLLERWQDPGNDRPESHETEQESRLILVEGRPNTEILPNVPQLEFHSELDAPLVQKRIETYDKDYFDITREKLDSVNQNEENSENQTFMSEKLNSGFRKLEDAGSNGRENDTDAMAKWVSDIICLPVSPETSREHQIVNQSETSQAIVILKKDENIQVLVGDSPRSVSNQLVVRNVEIVASSEQEAREANNRPCECSRSIFSGNDDLISFFLPLMGKACTCGQHSGSFVYPDDPEAIENILRPWQVEFLKSFGIHRGDQLVKARHRSASVLAKGLRQWRRKQDMVPFKTSACGMAIHIWAKTCKAFVRSIRKHANAGNLFLDEQPGGLAQEFTNFLDALPAAPERREEDILLAIEPDSQVEV